jgi:putative ABC transport system permease protein
VGRILLIVRLAARDLRRRPGQAILVLIVIAVCAATLTVGLTLGGVTDKPYEQTRAATTGADVLAEVYPPAPNSGRMVDLADLNALVAAPGVVAHSGPYPVVQFVARANGQDAQVLAEGRDSSGSAPVDQPMVTQGNWVRDGGVVVERAFAEALGVHVGDQITVSTRTFHVVGTAVSASVPTYPQTFDIGWSFHVRPTQQESPGLMWLSQADVRSLTTPDNSPGYLLNLSLANRNQAEAFVAAHRYSGRGAPHLVAWQTIRDWDNQTVENVQQAMTFGSILLGLLAIASVAVLVGGRLAEQTRRVGLLKAVGGTPELIVAILLAEQLVLALLAAAVGLLGGRLIGPLLTNAGTGLVGTARAPSVSLATIGIVVAVAVGVAGAATLVPAFRAARTSTVSALANSARPPTRSPMIITLSARLPIPMLLGLRLAARRPRRSVLNALGFFVTITGIVTMLCVTTFYAQVFGQVSHVDNPRIDRIQQLMVLIAIMIAVLATVNTMFITWATVLDTRHASALIRALGATPEQVTAGLCAAQVIPALAGIILGIPGGIFLNMALRHGFMTLPPWWTLVVVVLGFVLAVTALTTAPARVGARRSAAEYLQAEAA